MLDNILSYLLRRKKTDSVQFKNIQLLCFLFVILSPFSFVASSKIASPTCDLCVTVVSALEDFIKDDTTMEQILEKVEEICASLGALEGLCISTIESFLPGIIEGILDGQLNPNQICAMIGLCTEETTLWPDTTIEPGIYDSKNDQEFFEII